MKKLDSLIRLLLDTFDKLPERLAKDMWVETLREISLEIARSISSDEDLSMHPYREFRKSCIFCHFYDEGICYYHGDGDIYTGYSTTCSHFLERYYYSSDA